MQTLQRCPVQPIIAGCKMQGGQSIVERHNQVTGIVYRNICAKYELEIIQWEIPLTMVKNVRAIR